MERHGHRAFSVIRQGLEQCAIGGIPDLSGLVPVIRGRGDPLSIGGKRDAQDSIVMTVDREGVADGVAAVVE